MAVISGCGDVDDDATDVTSSREIAHVGHVSVYFNVRIATLEIRRLEAVGTGKEDKLNEQCVCVFTETTQFSLKFRKPTYET